MIPRSYTVTSFQMIIDMVRLVMVWIRSVLKLFVLFVSLNHWSSNIRSAETFFNQSVTFL